MALIRPLEREDLEQVTRMVATGLPGWSRDTTVLTRNLIDHPWTERPPRALVAVGGNGAVIGSLGAQTRRICFDGRKLKAVCVSHLVVDPAHRGGAAGALLVRALLAGEQDFTFTDSGTPEVVRIWRMFGAHLDHTRCSDWTLVLRPGRWLGTIAASAWSRRRVTLDLLPGAAVPVHAAGRQLFSRAFPAPESEIFGEDVSVARLSAALPSLQDGIRLRVDYDGESLEWVFDYLAQLTGSEAVVRRLVHRGARPIGWYAYLHRPKLSRVLAIGASAREAAAVLGELVEDARHRGTAALTGRFEPHLHEALRERYPALGLAQRPLVHARDPELLATLGSSAALLTEMDLIDTESW